MRRAVSVVGAVIGLVAFPRRPRRRRTTAGTALNIIPSGQYGASRSGGRRHPGEMYDGLTPLFDKVTPADLTTYFKSERFGASTPTPGHDRGRPPPGREDRARLLQRAARDRRDPRRRRLGGRLDRRRGSLAAARAGALQRPRRRDRRPGLTRISLITGLQDLRAQPADRGRGRPAEGRLEAAGPEGRPVLHDIDVFVAGSTTTGLQGSSITPWTPQRRLRAQRAQGPVRRPGRR